MALIVYNRENSRPQEVTYKGKRTINLDSRGTVYLSKTMSIELGILGGGRVNFAHDVIYNVYFDNPFCNIKKYTPYYISRAID